MKKPNFFIVGAGKCGTTALYTYLRDHPQVFMPRVKEPRFFADDMPNLIGRIASRDDYLALFAESAPEHIAVGEASPQYLYSSTAIRRIRDFNDAGRLIVMLRNPVDMVHAAHAACLYWFVEDEPDFEKAWRLQPLRRKGERIPKLCAQPTVLLWEDMARFGEQVERLLNVFPREQVKFIFLEDFAADPRAVYEDVLAFLGLAPDARQSFPRINTTRRHRIAWLGQRLLHPPRLLAGIKAVLEKKLRMHGVWPLLCRLNSRKVKRPPISPAFRRELVEDFREDVRKLAGLLGRDLTHWHA